MTDAGISSLTQEYREIKAISIAGCDLLTDASVAAIGETCKGLTGIDMSHNTNMTDAGMRV